LVHLKSLKKKWYCLKTEPPRGEPSNYPPGTHGARKEKKIAVRYKWEVVNEGG
jgi:hypothetical protein